MKLFPTGLEIDARLVTILQHDLLDVEDWIIKAILGKAASCQKRLIQEQKSIVVNDPDITALPKSDNDLADLITSHAEYENREQREARMLAEAKALAEAQAKNV